MQFVICFFGLIALAAVSSHKSSMLYPHALKYLLTGTCTQCDSTLQGPYITATPDTEPYYDLASHINSFTSAMADPTSIIKALETGEIGVFIYLFDQMTASAASSSASLSRQLSTADATGSASIQSQLSQVAANVSHASSALQAAQSIFNYPSSTTSSSTGGVGCVQTAAVGMGALVGGMAVLAHL